MKTYYWHGKDQMGRLHALFPQIYVSPGLMNAVC